MQQVKKCGISCHLSPKIEVRTPTVPHLMLSESRNKQKENTVFYLPPTSHSIVKEQSIYLGSNNLSYVLLDPCIQRQSENDGLLPLRNLILIPEEFRRGGGGVR